MRERTYIKVRVSAVIATTLALLFCVSCIYEGLDPCPRGIRLRFVFDYNMEYANAFHSQVDCYSLLIYDEDGNYLNTFTEEGDTLKNENYRLQIDLPHGKYHFIAYGGMTCNKRSFDPILTPGKDSKVSDMQVMMHHDGMTSDKLLHDFYFGELDVEVKGELYTDATLNMVRNTNNIRILLQQLDGTAVPADEFVFKIVDDNTLFDYSNHLIPNGIITYYPWSYGIVGTTKSTAGVGYAELSTSRLMIDNNPRLIITRKKDNYTILDIPLNQYLLLLKSQRFDKMAPQEFLDRQNNWSLLFFLDSKYKWVNTQIVINDWVVRIKDIDNL